MLYLTGKECELWIYYGELQRCVWNRKTIWKDKSESQFLAGYWDTPIVQMSGKFNFLTWFIINIELMNNSCGGMDLSALLFNDELYMLSYRYLFVDFLLIHVVIHLYENVSMPSLYHPVHNIFFAKSM